MFHLSNLLFFLIELPTCNVLDQLNDKIHSESSKDFFFTSHPLICVCGHWFDYKCANLLFEYFTVSLEMDVVL